MSIAIIKNKDTHSPAFFVKLNIFYRNKSNELNTN